MADATLPAFPPSRAASVLQAVDAFLTRPDVEVRRYATQFLHGKAYLLGDTEDGRAALSSSANLTSAGLGGNLELVPLEYSVGGLTCGFQRRSWRSAWDHHG